MTRRSEGVSGNCETQWSLIFRSVGFGTKSTLKLVVPEHVHIQLVLITTCTNDKLHPHRANRAEIREDASVIAALRLLVSSRLRERVCAIDAATIDP